jgi:hypothetical protein
MDMEEKAKGDERFLDTGWTGGGSADEGTMPQIEAKEGGGGMRNQRQGRSEPAHFSPPIQCLPAIWHHWHTNIFFCQLRKSKRTTQRLPSANLVSITGITGVVLITLSS